MSRFEHKTQTVTPIRRRLPAGTILNRAGKPVNALIAPAGASSMVSRLDRVNAWREHLNPLRGLSISRAIALLEEYQVGRMADVQWTFFFTEMTDPDLIALLALRVGRLVEMDYNLNPEEDADEKLIEDQTAYLTEKLAAIDNLYEAIEHLAMAPFRGYAHVEKHLDAAGDVVHFEPVDQWNLVRDGLRGAWKYNPTARSADYLSIEGEDLPLDRFLFRETRRPINRFALLKFVRGGLTEKDWDAFNEIYNVPGGVVTGPPEIPEGDEALYEEGARRVAEGGNGYLPYGSTYTPNEMPHDPQTFKLRLDYLSEKLVLAGTGGKLTMLTESGSGTLAGGAHAEVFDRIASAEAKRISEIITAGLITPWLEAEFPGKEQVVFFGLAANEETDSGAAVDQVQKLSQAGYQVDPEQVTQKTGWKVTLKAAPVAALAGASATGDGMDTATAASDGMGDAALPADGMPNGGSEPMHSITNRQDAAAGSGFRFMTAASQQLAAADRAALKPVIDRVAPLREQAAKLAEITDEAAFRTAYDAFAADLRRFQAELPALEQQCLGDKPSAALDEAFSAVIGTALVDGMDSGRAATVKKTVQNARKSPRGYQSTRRAAKGPRF